MQLFKTTWGAVGSDTPYPDFASLIPAVAAEGWDGVSFALIALEFEPGIGSLAELRSLCDDHDLGLSVMAHTSGSDVDGHIRSLQDQCETAAGLGAHHIICHGGVDAWSMHEARAFYEAALALEQTSGMPIAHETHRSRLLHSPWQAEAVLREFPDLAIALDLSHWVVMSERMLDDQAAAIGLAAANAIHIDARVGFEQGPQVPDPRDQAWNAHVEAFESWWDLAVDDACVVVPEYGPPPYLPTSPYTGEPVADLWEICSWAKDRLDARYRPDGGAPGGSAR